MKTQQKSGPVLICIALLIVVAALVAAGCLGSTPCQQGRMTPTGNQQGENPAAATTVTTRISTPPASLKTAQPTPAPVFSNAVVTFDPIGDGKIGEPFTITGTTSLPAGTNLFWQVRQDTGKHPTGIDMNSRMGIMANNVVTKGDGTANRVSLTVDAKNTKDLTTGKYIALVVTLKGDPMTVDPATGSLAGYTYLTLR